MDPTPSPTIFTPDVRQLVPTIVPGYVYAPAEFHGTIQWINLRNGKKKGKGKKAT